MFYFIVNAVARSGKAEKTWEMLQNTIDAADIPYAVLKTQHTGHSTELAIEICEKAGENDKIIVFGGDGTLNGVINGLSEKNAPALGFIPFGSGNDFARGLGLPTDPNEALNAILHSKNVRTLDLGEVACGDNTRRFCISGGAGYDAGVCEELDRSRIKKILNKLHAGKLAYFVIGFKHWLSHPKVAGEIIVDGKDSIRFDRLSFVSAHNLKYEGGGYPFAPGADPEDGRLSLCIVAIRSRLKFFCALLPSKAKEGWHAKFKGTKLINCKNAVLKTEKKLAVHTDGEVLGKYDDITFRILPARLRLLV